MNDRQKAKELAGSICSCPELYEALGKPNHPCHAVVITQNLMIKGDEKMRQRPEPWVGNLQKAKVLFISSNPSISDDEDVNIREKFPTFGDSEEDSAEFFLNRFDNQINNPHATFNYRGKVNFLYQSFDGKFRGKGGTFDKPIETWQGIHERAKEILGDDCDPTENYALTEVVKCKSKAEKGVREASARCIETWMDKVMEVSPAKLIVIIGAAARDNFAHNIPGIGTEFGADSRGYEKLGQQGRALRDIRISNFGGRQRIFIFNWHPTSMIPNKKLLLQLKNAFGVNLLIWMQTIVNNKAEIPNTPEALQAIIKQLTAN